MSKHMVTSNQGMETSANLEQIFHPAGISDLYETVNEFVEVVNSAGKPLKLCFNATTVTAEPGQTAQEIMSKWEIDRADYQSTKDESHPVLCHICSQN